MRQSIVDASRPLVLGGVASVENGFVTGWAFDAASPTTKRRLAATIGDRTVECTTGYDPATFGISGAPPASGFLLPIPVSHQERRLPLKIADPASQVVIYEGSVHQPVLAHANGNTASDIQRLQKKSLAKLQYFNFRGDILRLQGFAQSSFASEGDRSEIRVEERSGANVRVNPYIRAPDGHAAVFWYLPGAEYSGIEIEIELASIKSASHEIEVAVLPSNMDHPVDILANTTWWPSRLERYCPYPDLDRLQRVHTSENLKTVAMSGYSDARRLRRLHEHYAGPLSGRSILDWGCGHGRVVRHFAIDGDVTCAGVDIDRDNISWAQHHIAGIEFAVGGLHPPMPFANDSFDFVYGISVMTHLAPDVQSAWLLEISRVMRGNGLCILSFAGDASVAFSSQFMDPAWIRQYHAEGLNSSHYHNFTAPIRSGYYGNNHQSIAWIRSEWKHLFEIVDIRECVFGYQDIAVLRNTGH